MDKILCLIKNLNYHYLLSTVHSAAPTWGDSEELHQRFKSPAGGCSRLVGWVTRAEDADGIDSIHQHVFQLGVQQVDQGLHASTGSNHLL